MVTDVGEGLKNVCVECPNEDWIDMNVDMVWDNNN